MSLLVLGLVSCGGGNGDGGGDPAGGDPAAANSGAGGGGLPNSCLLFTEEDTAAYGGLGEGSRTDAAADLCIYGATINGKILQISIFVAPAVAYASGVDTLDASYAEGTKTPEALGEGSFLYTEDLDGSFDPEGRAALIILQDPYVVQVTVRLDAPEVSVRAIMDVVLGRL